MQTLEKPMTVPRAVPMVASLEGRWWLCQTRPRFEQRLAEDLARAGFGFYLPIREDTRIEKNGRGVESRKRVRVPAVPGYLFLCGDDEARYFAARSVATSRILDVVNQRRFISELRKMEAEILKNPDARVLPKLERGMAVQVVEGGYQGCQGIMEREGKRSVFIYLPTLGQLIETEIERHCVAPLN